MLKMGLFAHSATATIKRIDSRELQNRHNGNASYNRRIATFIAFLYAFEISALDNALDMLDMLVTEITAQAKMLGQKQRLRTIRDLDKAALSLRDVCSVLLDESVKDKNILKAIFKRTSKEKIKQAIKIINELARPEDDNYHKELTERYRRVRIFLPKLFNTVSFQAAPSGLSVLNALRFIVSANGRSTLTSKEVPLDFVPL